jgi:7-cyano-7-deazaguanine synthase in queuosine biosynthesis
MTKKVMILLSEGLDSSVMLMKLKQAGDVAAIFVDRGQSNLKSERSAVSKIVARANCHLDEIDITSWWSPVKGKIEMFDVPRNPIFALLASPFAMMQSCTEIAIGSTLDDANMGDSSAKFVEAFNRMIDVMELPKVPRMVAPLLDLKWNKTAVTGWAREHLGEEFINMTHSCWKQDPCGTCPACLARETALRESRVES